jgi:glutamate dehydrogenase (NAD(P)+)
MINAYNDLFETYASRKKVKELRTASFVLAIDRIAQSYMELGIFP